MLDQRLAALGLLDLGRAGKQRFEVAILLDQQGGSLDSDAGHARNVIDAVAAQGLHVDHLVWRHAEFFEHFRCADFAVLDRIEHADLIVDQLHQVLVRRDDRHARALGGSLPCIGGDEIVGLEALHLECGLAKGDGGAAHQRELGDQVLGRIGTLRLVLVVEIVAKGMRAGVEYAGEVCRLVPRLEVLQHLPQHVAEARNRADGQAVRLARQLRQGVVGAEDKAGRIDQIDVARRVDGAVHGHERPLLALHLTGHARECQIVRARRSRAPSGLQHEYMRARAAVLPFPPCTGP